MSPTATMPSAADALTALNGYQPPSSTDVLSNAMNQYGVNDLQSRVKALNGITSNLTSSIAAVDPSVTALTAGSLVNEGQRQALVARNQAPLESELGTNNTALTAANGDLNTATGNAKDAAAATEQDNQNKEAQLLQTYNIANARETAAAVAKQQADQQAEAVREYNQSEADSNSNNAANRAASASSATPTAAAQKTAVANHVVSQLNSLKGSDGKVSEETWNNALNDFTAAGGTVREFWQNYSSYVNGKYVKTYAGYSAR